uniref:Small ribosomal subunit protein bS6c n=1 Tax=Compsopogon caeruleus TaxID=31354 RepID=A0A1Z1XBD1_9RHOD|nr:30S ribosomal protein S6 [Compsopogon caeruleus]ARX96165.1 30S ribosomal protein S6 [Compsopogon caeruleus]
MLLKLYVLKNTFTVLKKILIYSIYLKTINKYESILKDKGALNIFTQNRGRRHLAYPIKKNNDGIFLQLIFEGNGYIINTIEKDMRINDKIIRYITIKQ